MDLLPGQSREERSLEDYLFSGYRCDDGTALDADHQFAQPIPDEDFFGLQEPDRIESINYDSDGLERLENDEPDVICTKISSPSHLFDDDIIELEPQITVKQYQGSKAQIEDIFLDDFSESSYPNNEDIPSSKSAEQDAIKAKRDMFLNRIKSQVKLLGKKPKSINYKEVDKNEKIEFVIEEARLVSDSHSKFIFNKVFNQSKKAKETQDTPKRRNRSWLLMRESLTKRLCTQKRRVWDSLNKSSNKDLIDDEEEFFEKAKPDESPDPDEEEAAETASDGEANADSEAAAESDDAAAIDSDEADASESDEMEEVDGEESLDEAEVDADQGETDLVETEAHSDASMSEDE